jgi:hypothetical protein
VPSVSSFGNCSEERDSKLPTLGLPVPVAPTTSFGFLSLGVITMAKNNGSYSDQAHDIIKRLKAIEKQLDKLTAEKVEKELQLDSIQSGCRHIFTDPVKSKDDKNKFVATCTLCGKVSERVVSFN